MNLTELINECIRIKPGNKEFALFFDGESEWTAEIGNECQNIGLGEAPAEFGESGCSPEEAVSNLLEALRGVAEAADAIAGKPHETTWSGEGLPPVGTVCEYYWAADDSWRSGACVAHFDGRAVICDVDDEDCAERLDAHHVRPIRTPEQIAAEEREKGIAQIYAVLNNITRDLKQDAAVLWDLGYRKTETP